MQSIRKSVLIAHSAEAIFKLIDEVEDYPRFLPWCSGITLHAHTDTITDVTIKINCFGLKTQFRTRNENDYPRKIVMYFVEGPFQAFSGNWHLTALNAQACKIEFSLDYEFSSPALEKLLGPVFNKITATFVEAFVKQANLTLSSTDKGNHPQTI